MKLVNCGLHKFDHSLPIYNWYYPMSQRPAVGIDPNHPHQIFERLDTSIEGRAFYFHVPFCKSICTFCPFVRSASQDEQAIDLYARALIREIQLKAMYKAVSIVPVKAIFWGGGTPSIFIPQQIRMVGKAIHDNYDLSNLKEFSVELTAATVTPEKLDAFIDIGVTHARFGIQTFEPRYRKFFNLASRLEEVYDLAKVLPRYFSHTSFDMLYGMNGQTDEEFVSDIQKAIAVGIPNIDYYPINNVVTQPILHHAFEMAELPPTSGLRKFQMNVLLREYMSAGGFLPHNGHGYVKVPSEELHRMPVVTNKYTFWYHKYVYGYRDNEVIGFGTNAISSLNRYTIRNVESWERYVNSLLNYDTWEFVVGEHDPILDESKGVILHLSYHGYLEKNLINWNAVHPETIDALEKVVNANLVIELQDRFELTLYGWYWYVNLLYYLSPREEQRILDRFISERCTEGNRRIEKTEIPFID